MFLDLASCFEEHEFDEHLQEIKHKLRDAAQADIFSWFCRYQRQTFVESLLASKREAAGLKHKFFYNNANESINRLLKTNLIRKSTLKDIITSWEEKCTIQHNNCKRALLSEGIFIIKAQYSHLKIEVKWYSSQTEKKLLRMNNILDHYCPSETAISNYSDIQLSTVTAGCRSGLGRKK